MSEGFSPTTGSRITKVNTLGVQMAVSIGNTQYNEIWRLEYNRCIGVLVGSGGGASCCFNGVVVDTSFATTNPVVTYGNFHTDNWGMSIDPTTNWVYVATVQGNVSNPMPNPMIRIPIPNLAPQAWSVSSGYNFGEIASVMYATNGCCANGFNGMSASLNWLYTYDGTTLKKWNKMTGTQLLNVNTGGTLYASVGTASDICDNVYVGVGNQIKQYNPSLTQIGTIATAGTT